MRAMVKPRTRLQVGVSVRASQLSTMTRVGVRTRARTSVSKMDRASRIASCYCRRATTARNCFFAPTGARKLAMQPSCGRCTHLREPTDAALAVLRDPSLWCCQVCGSTDGVWVCLDCGHVGCGRRARLPSLGGGHARHHHLASGPQHGSVCLDAVSKQLYCQACDRVSTPCDGDILPSPPWLETLRQEMSALEVLPPSRTPSKHSEAGGEWPAGALGCTGLSNLGNTCFINATFQALSHCKGFRDFFRDYVKAVAPMTLGNVRIQRMNTPAWKQRAEAEPAEEAHVTKVPQP